MGPVLTSSTIRRRALREPRDGLQTEDGVVLQNVVPRLLATPGAIHWRAPELGEHNADVYAEMASTPRGSRGWPRRVSYQGVQTALALAPLRPRRFGALRRQGARARRGRDDLELEDGVAASEKARARGMSPRRAPGRPIRGRRPRSRHRPWRPRSPIRICDPRVRGLALPKVHSAEHLLALAEIASSVESERGLEEGHTVFFPRIEGRRACSTRPRSAPPTRASSRSVSARATTRSRPAWRPAARATRLRASLSSTRPSRQGSCRSA